MFPFDQRNFNSKQIVSNQIQTKFPKIENIYFPLHKISLPKQLYIVQEDKKEDKTIFIKLVNVPKV